jgi:V/A-type H+/Na+-transporting ATPase subunit A
MACIPGPFGAGKTVLQNLIVRTADVDVVIVVACGERAGEVVETITELPHLKDPKTGGSLMDRTVIICNTSSMPVAAREASIYTGITLGEYYRQMGLQGAGDRRLHLALGAGDARDLRPARGDPGRGGVPGLSRQRHQGRLRARRASSRTNDGSVGSLTMIGTVSPAGGNFEEPVTQSTLAR